MSFASFTNKCLNFRSQHHVFKPINLELDFDLCNLRSIPTLLFLKLFKTKLGNERSYKASIDSIKLKLQELEKANIEVQCLKQQKLNGYKKNNRIFHYHNLLFVIKAIYIEFISRHHNALLVGHFDIKKICKFLAPKYYWPTLWHNVKAYIKGYNICLTSNAVRHKLYNNFQLLLISIQ